MTNLKKREYQVKGMACEHCANAVSKSLNELEEVTEVKVDLNSGKVVVTLASEIDEEAKLKAAIENAGYTVV